MALLLQAPIRVTGQNINEMVFEAVGYSTFFKTANPLVKTAVKGNYDFEDITANVVLYAQGGGAAPIVYGSDATYTQHTGTVCPFRMSSLLLHSTFIDTMQALGMAIGIKGELITQTQAWPVIEKLFMDKLARAWSTVALYGDVNAGYGAFSICDGVFVKHLARGGNIVVAATAAYIDETSPVATHNVATEMQSVIEAMPDDAAYSNNLGEGTPVLFVSSHIWKRYKRYQQRANTTGGSTVNITQDGMKEFSGYEVRVLIDLKPYEMYFTHESNVMAIFDDENELSSIDLFDLYHSESRTHQLSLDAEFRAAVDVRDARRLVYYY